MAKIQTKINFGNESLQSLIDEIIKEKLREVTYRIKHGEFTNYNQGENYPSTNNSKEKVDEIK